jgi:acyl-homoserine lactone acylase PvdQ
VIEESRADPGRVRARSCAAGAFAAVLLAAAPLSSQDPPPAATIHRDAWGVPHVFSETDAGVVYGMAWALAEDDWPLIEGNYLHALGRFAERVGEDGLADDWMARALEIVPRSVREYESSPPRMRRLLDAFAAGMNDWLSQHSERDVLTRVEPWYPLALIRYKYYQNEFLGYAGLRDEWARSLFDGGWRATSLDGSGAEAPPVDAEPRYYEARFGPFGERPLGSNEWALGPARTADGTAMLLINPHQRFLGVQRYAEIHLDSREGLTFSGLTVFGFLLPYMGHNGRLGWAYTDNYADHGDLYAETFDDAEDPLRYRYGEGYRSAETWTDSIRVRTDSGLETRRFRYWKTHHGPIVGVHADGRPLAVKLARLDEGGWFLQWDEMIRARSLEEWRQAMSRLNVAYMNTMYADADGHIGYVYNSAVPRRSPGVDPSGILDGSDPDTEWQGFHELDELPQVFDPADGWLLNTNSSPFVASARLPFDRSDFPAYMVGSEGDNPRARSSRRVLESLRGVTFDDFAAAVWDSRLSEADSMLPRLFAEADSLSGHQGPFPTALDAPAARGRVAQAVGRLRAWDGVADTASVETTWFMLTVELRGASQQSRTRTWPWTSALAEALVVLEEEWGTREVPWGSLNRHQRPLPGRGGALDPERASLPVGGAPGGLGSVFTYNSSRYASAEPGIGLHGNSYVAVIEFGPQVRARSILNYGQSGNPASLHFFDQAELYADRRFKPAWFTREEVEANSVESYRVGGG